MTIIRNVPQKVRHQVQKNRLCCSSIERPALHNQPDQIPIAEAVVESRLIRQCRHQEEPCQGVLLHTLPL